jgi:hypothetical protein
LRRLLLPIVTALGALIVISLPAAPAHTTVAASSKTYNLPSTTEAVSNCLNSQEQIVNFCAVTDLSNSLNIGGAPLGTSPNTPFLSTEGQDGAGTLILAWVDSAKKNPHMSVIDPPDSSSIQQYNGFNVSGTAANDTTDTSSDGPAFVAGGYGSSSQPERFWLMFAGTNSNRNLNIVEYTPYASGTGLGLTYAGKTTEPSHASDTDIGGAYATGGSVWMSYCGTNNVVYYQTFSALGGGTEKTVSGSCYAKSCESAYSGLRLRR